MKKIIAILLLVVALTTVTQANAFKQGQHNVGVGVGWGGLGAVYDYGIINDMFSVGGDMALWNHLTLAGRFAWHPFGLPNIKNSSAVFNNWDLYMVGKVVLPLGHSPSPGLGFGSRYYVAPNIAIMGELGLYSLFLGVNFPF